MSTDDAFTASDWGIDTVAIKFAIDPGSVDVDASMWTNQGARRTGMEVGQNDYLRGDLQTGDGTVKLTLWLNPGTVRMEFNAARVLGWERPALLPTDALRPLVNSLIAACGPTFAPTWSRVDLETGEITQDEDWAEQVKVVRLDIARDVAIPVHLETAFANYLDTTKPRYGRTASTYKGPKGGITQYNLSATQGCERVYNKDAEMGIKGRSDVRRWRFETQVQADRLKRFGLTTLAGVRTDRAWDALQDRWAAMRLDQHMPVGSVVLERLAPLEKEAQREAMAYLAFQTMGKAADHYSRREAGRIRGYIKEIGLNPKKSLTDQPGPTMSLSLETGLLHED